MSSVMDFPSKNMYDTFKDEIWKELGPLDPDWFEALTAQTLTAEANVSDQEELCANQEGNFKAPLDKTAVDSQLFSTPKVFRHRPVVTPETGNEQSLTSELEKEKLPWTQTQSPCLFQMPMEGVPGTRYDLLHTPQRSPISYAKQISESLGAQIHADMSWTSSLNTPTSVPSTLILTKTEESPCPGSVPADNNVVFVRKLFPSLSNPSRVGDVSPKNSDMPTLDRGFDADAGQNQELGGSPKSVLDESWRQTLPDAIEDGEIRSTVANVLKGAEKVLSIFFTNSSSALRKVKTDRVKRRQILPAEETGCGSTAIPTPNNASLCEQPAADQESKRLCSPPPVNTGDNAITQWSPLSLSDIPPSADSCYENSAATQLKNNILTESLQNGMDSGLLVTTPLKITDSGFTKKKRKFVYAVKSSKQATETQKMDSSPRIADSGQNVKVNPLGKSSDEANGLGIWRNETKKQESKAEDALPPFVQAQVQDLDMSQLCRDFAQDFSQMSEPCQLSKVAEDTPQNGFTPSACLSAIKEAKQKTWQANTHNHESGAISNKKHISATNQSNLLSEVTISDSGFQSAVTDLTHMTATSFILPSSENNIQSQQWSGFQGDLHRTTGKAHLEVLQEAEAESDAELSSTMEQSNTLGPGRENELHKEKTLLPSRVKTAVDNIDCSPLNGQVQDGLPGKATASLPSVHASGFKTASNKGIRISSANLQRAKRLFEDTEGERALSGQLTNCAPNTKDETCTSHGSVKKTSISNQPSTFAVTSCQLTASQKADVTELCTLLEEAGSQFEFTPFTTTKIITSGQDNSPSPQKVNREIDPDLLKDIDFDDSFSTEAEKPSAVPVVHQNSTLVSDSIKCHESSITTSKPTGFSLPGEMTVAKSSAKDESFSSEYISAGSSSIKSAEVKSLDRAGATESSLQDNKNPLTLDVGFKTGGGNVLRVSKKCLSKARALFADLEKNPVTSQNLPDKRGMETDAKTQHQRSVDNPPPLDHNKDYANFKGRNDDNAMTSWGCFSNMKESVYLDGQVKGIKDENPASFHSSRIDTKTCQNGFLMASGKGISISAKAMQAADAFFKECDIMDSSNEVMSGKPKRGIEPLPISAHKLGLKETPTSAKTAALHGNLSRSAKALSSLSHTTLKNNESFDVNNASHGDGFCQASAEKVTVSADAMKTAEGVSTCQDTSNRLKHKGDPLREGHLTNQGQVTAPKGVGFQTASGKGFSISPAALKKAQTLLGECDEVEDEISMKQTHSKVHVPQPGARNGGFLAASGKPVVLSAEALQKAKALFSDISVSAEVSDTGGCEKKQLAADNTKKVHLGFSTAGGAKVHLSQKNLLKAKALLKEFDESKSAEALQETDVFFKDNNSGISDSGNENKGLKIQPNQRITNISEKPGCGRIRSENLHLDGEIHKEDFKQTSDSSNSASAHRNQSLRTKPFSSLSSTTSNNINSSAISDWSSGGGFNTASGKKVSVLDEAMTKARSLLSESNTFEDTNKVLKDGALPPLEGGFQTASGKGFSISPAALKKAQTLLGESDKVETEISVKPTHSKVNVGFHAASGKTTAPSAEALQKPKALFSDISVSAEILDTGGCEEQQLTADNTKKIHLGFSTAGGAKVHVSQKNLLRAKTLLKEFDDESTSAEAMQDANVSGQTRSENLTLDGQIHKEDFDKTRGCPNSASVHRNQTMREKHLFSLSSTTSNNINSSAVSGLSSSGGFSTTSGKKVSVSDEAMIKARSLLSESNTFEDTNQVLKEGALPPLEGGFETASGKVFKISSEALKKANHLFSECEKVEDKKTMKQTHSNMQPPAPWTTTCGFLSAGGKHFAPSSDALQKAKALFSDIELSEKIPAVLHKINSNEEQSNAGSLEKMQFGFTTAGGAKVHVSQKNLMKAKALLKEFDDGECHDVNTQKPDLSNLKEGKKPLSSDAAKPCDKEMPDHESISEIVTPLTSLQMIQQNPPSGPGNLCNSPVEETSCLVDHKRHPPNSSEDSKIERTEESSVLHFQSLNLSSLTKTQQKFLAQEALDCAKALLEDDVEMQLESAPLEDNQTPGKIPAEEQKGKGKRQVEDPDVTGQPPLKRRLLEEFDRAVDGPKVSQLHPEISCPNGLMKDRRLFKYSTSLHPNITKPHKSGNQFLETRLQKTVPTLHKAPLDSRSGQSKARAFVPPFLKNTKTGSRKNTVLKENIRTPPAFVPPFKKQRTFVQDSSSKPQEEEDKHHNSFVMPSKCDAYVPPTKQTQSTASGTENKSTEGNKMEALVENTKSNMINNQNLSPGCGSDEPAAKVSRVEDVLPESQEVLQNLHNVELARDMQDMRIRKKKRQTIRPLPGSLFLTKTSGVSRISLKSAVNGKPPGKFTQKQLYGLGVHQHVCEITSETAESFRFRLQQFIRQEAFIDGGGVQLADGGWLIPSNDGTAGKQEFYRALCDTPGVDPKLISEEWVFNHYRWIVWKQASMERSFPETMGSLCLTPEQVLLQLKYRYDVEVDHSRRPALRKIMEKDDTAAKSLVLCVSGVVSRGHSPKRQSFSDTKTPQAADNKVQTPCAVVWLTDGWYAIKAQLDEPLTAMLHRGRLAVGGKLIIHGAQLVGSQDACSPLEAPESLMLKICANSSRPTRWDVKLGFHKDPRPFVLPVSSLYSSGGPVGCVDIVVLRSYPIQWMERKPDGGVVFRSVRAEEKEARRYNSQKQKSMEILYAKIQAEFEKEEKGNKKPQRRRRTISHQDVARLQDGEDLYEAVEEDPAYLEAHLSEQQLETLHTYRRSVMEKKQAELQERYRRALENAEESEVSCPKRDVTPVWRLCFADSRELSGSVSQLNLWRPSSDLQSMIKEGCRYKVYNLTTSEGKKLGGSTTVQLTGTKKTQFEEIQASREWISTRFKLRASSNFVDVQNPEFQPLCGEIDLTGCVVSVLDGQGSSPAFYLADGKLNFMKVRCFSSLAQFGLEDLVKPHVFLALSNLQLRGQSSHPTPVVYAGDLTVFSTNPKEAHLQDSLSQLRSLVQGQENFFLTAEEKLSHLVGSEGSISSPALQTRTPVSTADRRQNTKTSVTSQLPVRGLGSFTPVSRNAPTATGSSEKDPVSLKRRRALDYLSRIPSPPPLTTLSSAASPCVNKTFNPPRRSATPSTLKTAQTPARKPVDPPVGDEWVNDEELAMINTQDMLVGGLL